MTEVDHTWKRKAACRGMETKVFYPLKEGNTPRQQQERTKEAKAICARCDVSEQCWQESLRVGSTRHGIWAGMTPKERQRRRKREGIEVVVETPPLDYYLFGVTYAG